MTNQIMQVSEKTCYLCGHTYPATVVYFNKHNQHLDGLENRCKNCTRSRANKYYSNHKDMPLSYRNRNIEKVRAWERQYWDEHSDKRREKVQRAWAKFSDRYLEKHKEYYQRNKDRLLSKIKDWREAHPDCEQKRSLRRRMIRRNVPPTKEALDYVDILRGDPCPYCGQRDRIEIDHILAVTRGGNSDALNLSAACRKCNQQKSNKSMIMFLYERSL